MIKDLEVGAKFDQCFLLKRADIKKTTKGKDFLALTVSDGKAEISGNMWDNFPAIETLLLGKPIHITGQITEYRGTKQMKVESVSLEISEENQEKVGDLIPKSEQPVDKMMEFLVGVIANIKDQDYSKVAMAAIEENDALLSKAAAAVTIHHNYQGGLLTHVTNMLKGAMCLAKIYPWINQDLLFAGVILHDIGKLEELAIDENGLSYEYTAQGTLLGHLYLGAAKVKELCEKLGVPANKSLLLQHILLSHHGQLDFGSPVVPKCPEAILVNMLDLIDSRMDICQTALSDVEAGKFSDKVFALEGRLLYQSKDA